MARWLRVVMAAGLAASLPTWLMVPPAFAHRADASGRQHRRRHVARVYGSAWFRDGDPFETLRRETNQRNQEALEAHSTGWQRAESAGWHYVWPYDSPHGWDAASSYDWTYYWWRAARPHPSPPSGQDLRHMGPAQSF